MTTPDDNVPVTPTEVSPETAVSSESNEGSPQYTDPAPVSEAPDSEAPVAAAPVTAAPSSPEAVSDTNTQDSVETPRADGSQ